MNHRIFNSYNQEPKSGVSGGLELGADPVARDLVPVDLGPSHRQLPPQGLEGRVRHRLQGEQGEIILN